MKREDLPLVTPEKFKKIWPVLAQNAGRLRAI